MSFPATGPPNAPNAKRRHGHEVALRAIYWRALRVASGRAEGPLFTAFMQA